MLAHCVSKHLVASDNFCLSSSESNNIAAKVGSCSIYRLLFIKHFIW